MKARTKIQSEVLAMAGHLPKLTAVQRAWARETLHRKVAYYWKLSGQTWCQHCGHIWRQNAPELYVSLHGNCICPECGQDVQMEHQKNSNMKYGECKNERLFAVVTSRGRWTVVRVFNAIRINTLGMPDSDKPTRYYEWEVWQDWIRDDGKEVLVTKTYHCSPYYFSWSYGSEWGIGKHNGGGGGYFVMPDVFDIDGVELYQRMRVSAIMRRNGFTQALGMLCKNVLTELMKGLLTDPMMEWLAKVGQDIVLYDELRYCRHSVKTWYHALRICVRNGYKVSDPTVYFDYLSQLREFGKDTHSPKYVCPKDLYHEHDKYTEKQTRRRAERMAQDARKYETAYRRRVGKYFGVAFGNDDIMVSVICSVAEMAEEGLRMHHCVFNNGYYEKKNTVILSARSVSGARLETVEVNTRSWAVVQSRGLQNNPSPKHAEIVQLVKENMHLLQACG